MPENRTAEHGLVALLRRLITGWALAGGGVLMALALMTTWSAASAFLFNAPVPGDFELMELGVAVAAFSFLPFCQLIGANVSADIFTARAGPRTVAALGLLASLIALGFGLLLLWRMYYGLLDYQEYLETTAILQIPLWYAFVPALVSLALLAVASVITLLEESRKLRLGD
ncbi:MAG: TRAP transporter small permease [Burkholderiales bacterium]|nr:MAG: TRAP transporter small permease [Burkholderiales bacterium]